MLRTKLFWNPFGCFGNDFKLTHHCILRYKICFKCRTILTWDVVKNSICSDSALILRAVARWFSASANRFETLAVISSFWSPFCLSFSLRWLIDSLSMSKASSLTVVPLSVSKTLSRIRPIVVCNLGKVLCAASSYLWGRNLRPHTIDVATREK